MIYNSPRCKCWLLSLVLNQRNSERKFESRVLYLFLYAFISFVVARNVIFGIFIFIA
jgi:hypothetical protein